MNLLPIRSPFDGGEIVVTRFYCPGSDTTVEGRFAVVSPFPSYRRSSCTLSRHSCAAKANFHAWKGS